MCFDHVSSQTLRYLAIPIVVIVVSILVSSKYDKRVWVKEKTQDVVRSTLKMMFASEVRFDLYYISGSV